MILVRYFQPFRIISVHCSPNLPFFHSECNCNVVQAFDILLSCLQCELLGGISNVQLLKTVCRTFNIWLVFLLCKLWNWRWIFFKRVDKQFSEDYTWVCAKYLQYKKPYGNYVYYLCLCTISKKLTNSIISLSRF